MPREAASSDAAIFGGPNTNVAGPMTAICSSDQAGPDRHGRYVATLTQASRFQLGAVVAFAIGATDLTTMEVAPR